uniref:mucin-16-like n=1 Tax=Pristiophorus japonicus TaxID=55135 RepID=UPI00398F2ED2
MSTTSSATTEPSTTSTQTSSAAPTTTSAPTSTAATTTESTTEASTTESTTNPTKLTSTSATTEPLTISTQTSNAAPTTTSAPTSTAATTTESTTEASTTESMTNPTTTLTSTSATTESSTINTRTSSAAPTTTSAPTSTVTTVVTTRGSATHESTTNPTTTLTSTSATTEPSTTSTQTSSAAPTTTSAPTSTGTTVVTTTGSSTQASMTSLTTTLSSISVEPPIVPVTNKPVQETQKKNFNVTFNVLTLPFTPSLQNLSSPLYTAESSNILDKLNNLYRNSKVNSTFLNCQSLSFRPASDGNSTVEAICTFIKRAAAQQVDKVQLYHEFQDNTKNIITLGTYSLDSNSLYVDGYHESAVLTTTTEPLTTSTQTSSAAPTTTSAPTSTAATTTESTTEASTTDSTTNPTTTLTSTSATTESSTINTRTSSAAPTTTSAPTSTVTTVVTTRGSATHESTTNPTTTLTSTSATTEPSTTSTQTSSAAPTTTSAPTSTGTTVVTTTGSSTQASMTSLTTTLSSISVEPPIVPVTNKPVQETQKKKFNVTFNVLTLPFTPSLQNLSSPLYTAESSNILDKLNNLYRNSKVNSTFLNCQSLSFRPASDGNSTVEAICTFIKRAAAQQVDKVQLYHEFQDNTKNIITLGTYSLDSNSLYVDGYHESAVLTTTTEPLTTSTHTSSAAPTTTSAPTSTAATTTESTTEASTTVLTTNPTTTLTSTSATTESSTINTRTSSAAPTTTSAPTSTVTTVVTTRGSATHESTTNPTTTLTSTSATTEPSTTSTQTSSAAPTTTSAPTSTGTTVVTTTGSSTQASMTSLTTTLSSISVEPPIVPVTNKPVQETQKKKFNVTFNVLTLPFTPSLQNLSSPLYTAESSNVLDKLNNLYRNSKVNSTFLNCQSLSFRPASDGNSTVEAICTFIKRAAAQQVDKVQLYHEFQDNTKNIITLGTYLLDSNSLYVDGYHESAVLTTIPPTVTTTQTPDLEEKSIDFNVTFIITNLQFTQGLQDSTSLPYISASNDISQQLTDLYNESKINAPFSSCKVVSFSLSNVDNTTVYAICTFRNDSTAQEVDKATVYHVFRDNTKNISTLGTYSLDNNSLYVNGYHESTPLPTIPPTEITTRTPDLEEKFIDFNVTFIITNLQFTQGLQDSTSLPYISASNYISQQLNDLYNKSKINAPFSSCKVVSFSPANVDNTSVYAICTFRNDSTAQEVDKFTVYHVFRDNTKNISTVGTYSLDNNSLYVNGYHESTPLPTIPPTVTTTQTPDLEEKFIDFNVTFIITNLQFTQSLQDSTSLPYISALNNISQQLTDLYNKSKINAPFSSCKVVSFSPANVDNTSVYAICTFRNDSTAQEVDKVIVYHVFRDNTNNISTLGTYSLDNNSLYVNGYHESTPLPTIPPTVTTTQTPDLEEKFIDFNVTFIITNLEFTQSLQDSTSLPYISASNNISQQLTDLYNKSKINAPFSSCKVVSFSPANVDNTSVYAICTFRNDSTAQEVDKVIVYHVFRDNTKKISTLGTYSLDNNSLYVNGYHESTPLPTIPPTETSTQTPDLEEKSIDFNVTFIITNLEVTQSLQDSTSLPYISASNNISQQLTDLYKKSKIYATFSSCKVVSFSPANVGNTSVHAICTFRNDSTAQDVDKVTVYHVFRDNTKNISTLATYSLDNNSLYINDYHESTPIPTITPMVTTTPNLQAEPYDFNVTFIITNLVLTASLQDSSSALYKSASSNFAYQMNNLFTNSNINRTFSSCRVLSFRPANIEDTNVYAVCTFSNDSAPQEVNKVTVYHEFRDNTNSISILGTYLLDNNSLYVNGYHESAPSPTLSPIVTTTPNMQTKPFNFNVTVIINNLAMTESLQDSSSALYKSASNIITYQLNNLFTNSNINRTFSSCRVLSFRPANIEDTTVYAVCTFTNDSAPQEVNKVTVYHEFRDNTKGISTLGTYSLDSNSLYVNGYHESAPSPTPIVITTPNLQTKPFDFNVTFIITNLALTANLKNSKSALFKSASTIIAYQMNNLFTNSNINRTFSSCRVLSFSLANIEDTTVYAVCTFTNESAPQEVNKVTVYHEFRANTNSISTLGTYLLDINSLYVNGYHESAPSPTPIVITTPNLQTKPFDFNVTFIITNLALTANLKNSNSALFKSASTIIAYQMNNLFINSNINRTFSSCRVLSFSLANIEDTSVYAVCTFTNESAPQEVNKVTVYHEFRDNTNSISTLGTYSLDINSLYVNGYHESAPSPTPIVITTPNLQTKPLDFNVTFIITNLALTDNLKNSKSALFKSASTIIAYQMNNLFTNSNINRTFSSCRVLSFSPANIKDTSVYAVCTFTNESAPQEINKVTVYHEFRANTNSISTLGTYLLDINSLYMNGYHESAPSPTPIVTTTPNLQTKPFDFNVTFIITNLALTDNLKNSKSALFKSASTIIAYQMNNLFTNSNINRTFSSCRVLSFSPANIEDTSVYAVCTFTNDSAPQEVNKVTVYHEFRDNTKSISILGTYSLDNNSLYVNGYHESAPSPTPIVITTPNLQTKPFDFNVTFIITNLALTANLKNSKSALFKSASTIIAYQMNNLFTNSNINRTFSSCRVLSFSLANVGNTNVYAICTFRNDSAPREVNKVTVYHKFRNNTNSISTLGTYSLDNNSLYVNGYHESVPSFTEAPIVIVTHLPNKETRPIEFNVTFTITNLTFTPDLQNLNYPEYTTTSNNVINSLNNLYSNSKIKKTFSNCKLISFSPANQGNTKVETLCSFKNDPTVQGVDKVTAYNEFRGNTEKITALGGYSLDKNSLYVNGYQELEPTATPTVSVPAVREGDLSFELNFTIINRNFIEALNDPNSPEYQSIVANVTQMLTMLYIDSPLKDSYRTCKVTGLRIGSVKCTCRCYFSPNAANEPVTAEKVRTEFAIGTNGTNLLANVYQLRNTSLSVEAKAPVSTGKVEIPYWGIILIVLGILLILFLLSLLCLLVALCLKKKYHGSYNTLQNPAGDYYPHHKYY